MKLIIIRHGKTSWNEEDRYQGRTDTVLSEEGKKQAEKLGIKLKNYNIDFIYSSPLKRALETAKEIKKYHSKTKFVIEKDLAEIDFGIFDGLTKKQAQKKYKEIYLARLKDKFNFKILKGESYAEVESRAIKLLNKIIKTKKNSVIVAHASLNRLLFKKLMNKTFEQVSKYIIKPAELCIFDVEGNKISVELFNCDKHLH